MRKINNPHLPIIKAFIIAAGILQLVSIVGWISGSALIGTLAGVFEFGLAVVIVVLVIKGQSELQKIYRLIAGENLLAHWAYPENVWEPYVEEEYKRQISNGKITMIVFLIAGPFVGYCKDSNEGVLYGIGLGICLGLLSLLMGYSIAHDMRKRSAAPPYEAFISSTSVYINGTFVDWSASGFSFVSASIATESKTGLHSLLVKYSVSGRYGLQEKEMYIPIPEGKTIESEKLIQTLTSSNKK